MACPLFDIYLCPFVCAPLFHTFFLKLSVYTVFPFLMWSAFQSAICEKLHMINLINKINDAVWQTDIFINHTPTYIRKKSTSNVSSVVSPQKQECLFWTFTFFPLDAMLLVLLLFDSSCMCNFLSNSTTNTLHACNIACIETISRQIWRNEFDICMHGS